MHADDASEGWLSTFTWLLLALNERRHAQLHSDLLRAGLRWRYDAPSRLTSLPPPQLSTNRPINVLCMDGGGIRGRCLLAMVEEMEQMLGGPVSAHFDLIAGTSIGGCGSIFLSRYPESGHATRMARLALTELQNRCFAQWNWRRLLLRGFLCRDARRELILELCGPTPLRTSGPRAFAVAARRRRGGRCGGGLEPFLFRTYDLPHEAVRRSTLQGTAQVALWQAVEATSAAPVLFPRALLKVALDDGSGDAGDVRGKCGASGKENSITGRGDRAGALALCGNAANGAAKSFVWLADGGLVANDPTAIALCEARALWPERPIGTVLSLGTGSTSPLGADDNNESARSPIGKVIRACGGPSACYYRLNPPVRGISMMDSNEAKLRAMEDATRRFFRESLDAHEACRRLVQSRAHWRIASLQRCWQLTARCVRLARASLLVILAECWARVTQFRCCRLTHAAAAECA